LQTKTKILKKFLFIAFVCCTLFSFSQSKQDSLYSIVNRKVNSPERVDAIIELASIMSDKGKTDSTYYYLDIAKRSAVSNKFLKQHSLSCIRLGNHFLFSGKYDLAEKEYKEAIKVLNGTDYKQNLGVAYKNLAIVYAYQGIFEKAIFNFSKGIELAIELKDTLGIAGGYSDIGLVYLQKNNHPIALNYFHKSLSIYENVDAEKEISFLYNNFGKIYTELHDYEKAIEFFQKNLVLANQNSSNANKAMALHNISISYGNQQDYKNAYKYALLALEIRRDTNSNKRTVGDLVNTLNQIGTIYFNIKDYSPDSIREIVYDKPYFAENPSSLVDSALALYRISEKITVNTDFDEQKSSTLFYIAEVFMHKGDFTGAIAKFKTALKILEELDVEYDDQAESCLNIYKAYNSINQKDSALKYYILYHEKYVNAYDYEAQIELGSEMASYELNRQHEIEQEKKEQQLLVSIEKEKNARLKLYFALGAGLLILILLLYILKSLREKKKANEILAIQKAQIEEKNNEITSSINYARHLQNSIQPKEEYISKYFPNNFQIYKPKDIVAGDFIWFKDIENTTEVVFGVGDCTGHGVPGAMVSVACSTSLDRTVAEFNITRPSLILQKSSEIISSLFGSTESVRDGMDIALCKLDLDSNILEYSGANNSLWIIRNGEMTILPSTRQTVGYVANPIPFENHEFQLKKGDLIYLFSDGYIDQFGGDKNKKLKSSGFKDLLLEVSSMPVNEQKKKMLEFFDKWKGINEQIDDVCVFGIRI